ncbi:uncharacterized protein SCHCODRAFT_02029771 [Schizophyllum commune H4-8]|uniref:uncharacterized protein n=1 Tax=Schizophyllum commune (strain H4-8 / FGSC 9210) TaxID=578458 RepID=UPI002160AE5A|nr:uncharacterized protein SCHCODRAFT_02029771 [Schizophyllum commune H4-8]KAI5900155.1 hypothetical protein SCHCODRAFT_02029771 [Schizophyllum commune H4-8]
MPLLIVRCHLPPAREYAQYLCRISTLHLYPAGTSHQTGAAGLLCPSHWIGRTDALIPSMTVQLPCQPGSDDILRTQQGLVEYSTAIGRAFTQYPSGICSPSPRIQSEPPLTYSCPTVGIYALHLDKCDSRSGQTWLAKRCEDGVALALGCSCPLSVLRPASFRRLPQLSGAAYLTSSSSCSDVCPVNPLLGPALVPLA